MEELDQKMKHICKFCYKSFPCGRSLGGHMRSHLINISSDHPLQNPKTNQKFPKKKLPPLINTAVENNIPNKSKDTLLDQEKKLCKECGKSFQSWKALFGHMKCHSINGKKEEEEEEDDRDSFVNDNSNNKNNTTSSSDRNQKVVMIMDSQSDNETATPLCRRKRSDRMIKRYTNSSSLVQNTISSSCVSEIDDQQEQEEVALSLILLSMDNNSISGVESSNNSSEFIEQAKKIAKNSNSGEFLKFKKLRNGKLEPTILHSDHRKLKNVFELGVSSEKKNLENEVGNESEVNSPKYLIKKVHEFEPDCRKNNNTNNNKRKHIDPHGSDLSVAEDYSSDFDQNKSKFSCAICKKAFPSYQALGGHRASHKKFKGCCAPTTNEHEPENPSQIQNPKPVMKIDGLKIKIKEHECPICLRVFASGQALGGHKRSHLIADQAKINSVSSSSNIPSNNVEIQKPVVPEIRNFLDLNLPAPVEDECDEFQPWWVGEHEPVLGVLSN